MTDNCSQSCEVGVSTEQSKEKAKIEPKYVDLGETENAKLSGFLTKAEQLLNEEMKRQLPSANQTIQSPHMANSKLFGVIQDETAPACESQRPYFGFTKKQPLKVHFERLKFQKGDFQVDGLFPESFCSTCDGFKLLCG